MAQLVRLRSTCDHGNVCPTLHYQPDSGDFLIQGYAVTDPQVLSDLNLSVGHAAVRIPTYFLPELQHDADADELLVLGQAVHDIELLIELNLPADEAVVRVPAAALPELRKETQPC